jgi:hypothetical protein
MPYIVHQDFKHHVTEVPQAEYLPWVVYPDGSTFPENFPAVWKPVAMLPAIEAQVAREYAGHPPPVVQREIPVPVPDEVVETPPD